MADTGAAPAPFSVSVTLAINPSTFQKGDPVELSATAVSHALLPITIETYWSILNLHRAQHLVRSRNIFQCRDLNTGAAVELQDTICGLRPGISHKLDHTDNQYFHTLLPEVPYTISDRFFVPYRNLIPGHKYLLSAGPPSEIDWWREGKKEDNLQKPGEKMPKHMWDSSGGPISVSVEPVEFTAPELT